jgi:hypothetical protein
MEKEQKATCPKCKRDFSWVNTGDVWPGGKEKESN